MTFNGDDTNWNWLGFVGKLFVLFRAIFSGSSMFLKEKRWMVFQEFFIVFARAVNVFPEVLQLFFPEVLQRFFQGFFIAFSRGSLTFFPQEFFNISLRIVRDFRNEVFNVFLQKFLHCLWSISPQQFILITLKNHSINSNLSFLISTT